MSSETKNKVNLPIVGGARCIGRQKFNVNPAANENIPQQEIQKALRENERRIQAGEAPVRKQLAFWRSFSDAQIQHAQQIYVGFLRLYGGGLRTQDYSFMPRATSFGEGRPTASEELFSLWARTGVVEDVQLTPILEILIFGLSCRQVDRKQGRRKGYARENLVRGLALYARLQEKYTKLEKTT
ncbi:hypothetical protein [Sneathiella glossodoripedis]|uniref:hypothetical protein n=1 Tax=Sneathiella glossodoripedis TaxID=418853 RepID=UPI00046EFBC4|nr:hypothetical protein [Sneathiella glossodoripedis]